MLYELVSAYREPMLQHMRDVDPEGFGLPRHVDRELEAFLRCGILAHGFTRVRCAACDVVSATFDATPVPEALPP